MEVKRTVKIAIAILMLVVLVRNFTALKMLIFLVGFGSAKLKLGKIWI